MLIVKVKDQSSIDRALKILKNKVVKTGQLKQLRARQEYVKPSIKRRDQLKKAIYIQHLRDDELKNE
jgi:small subunit ribosomal protein S21